MKTYLFIFLLLFAACKSTKKTNAVAANQPVEIEIVVAETQVNFNVKNNSVEPVNLINPRKLRIQKFEDNNWRSLKILICPCDAPCNAPEEKKLLTSNQSYSFLWNKKESCCGNRTSHGIRETVESEATAGLYKIILTLEKSDETIEITKEFEIK